MTDLLRDGLSQHAVQKTALTRKLTVDGATGAYPVYRIKLDQLYYNDQNDRIATWISQYRAQHGGRSPEPADREAYNQIIEGFIVESNPDAIRKTKANIKLVDQRESGVVLNDGRIIDGNRRFTCLRQFSAEDAKFGWFEAVILERSIEHSATAPSRSSSWSSPFSTARRARWTTPPSTVWRACTTTFSKPVC